MAQTIVRKKGTLTIPADIRNELHIEEGDPVLVEVVADGILLRPQKLYDATQAWFWTPRWQAMEREAEEDLAAGRFERFNSSEELLAALDERG